MRVASSSIPLHFLVQIVEVPETEHLQLSCQDEASQLLEMKAGLEFHNAFGGHQLHYHLNKGKISNNQLRVTQPKTQVSEDNRLNLQICK